jgi:hypothetical protein
LTELQKSRSDSARASFSARVSLAQFVEADRRVVDPPIQVESAAWSRAGELDWWVKDRQEWFGRVRAANGRQRWVKAVDLRPAKAE